MSNVSSGVVIGSGNRVPQQITRGDSLAAQIKTDIGNRTPIQKEEQGGNNIVSSPRAQGSESAKPQMTMEQQLVNTLIELVKNDAPVSQVVLKAGNDKIPAELQGTGLDVPVYTVQDDNNNKIGVAINMGPQNGSIISQPGQENVRASTDISKPLQMTLENRIRDMQAKQSPVAA